MEPRQLSDPETWTDQHGDYLYRCALLRVRDSALAEEVVQETFLAALQARDRFAGRSSETSWLVGILKHKVIDHFRKAHREAPRDNPQELGRELDTEGLFDEAWHWKLGRTETLEWPHNPSTELERKEFWEVLKRCLASLPPRMATAFSLREVDDRSSEEVCDALNITASNLWVILHRTRKQLRQCLEGHHFGCTAA